MRWDCIRCGCDLVTCANSQKYCKKCRKEVASEKGRKAAREHNRKIYAEEKEFRKLLTPQMKEEMIASATKRILAELDEEPEPIKPKKVIEWE